MGFKLRTSKRQWREKNRKGTHYEERQKSGNFLYKNEESQISVSQILPCILHVSPRLLHL